MSAGTPSFDALIDMFVSWAKTDDNIRAAVVVGSQARTEDHPADEWSDLDLLVVANDPQPLWEQSDWLRNIGVPWITFVEPTPDDGGYERRVLFEGGLDVDFAPIGAADLRALAGRPLPPVLADILRRGVRVILDKDGLGPMFQSPAEAPPPAPSPPEAEFLNRVNDFWYHAVWTAKHLRRGELWWSISCCNIYLKNLLRQMMEWHAHATRGPGVDTWMRGRFLEEWAGPKAVEMLPLVFARYDREDAWRALRATMDLFHGLASETAGPLHVSYPAPGEEKVRALVESLYSGRKEADAES
jgi:aminoglycoside 6-adenylyltransferase